MRKIWLILLTILTWYISAMYQVDSLMILTVIEILLFFWYAGFEPVF
jgi:hypothetical protein